MLVVHLRKRTHKAEKTKQIQKGRKDHWIRNFILKPYIYYKNTIT